MYLNSSIILLHYSVPIHNQHWIGDNLYFSFYSLSLLSSFYLMLFWIIVSPLSSSKYCFFLLFVYCSPTIHGNSKWFPLFQFLQKESNQLRKSVQFHAQWTKVNKRTGFPNNINEPRTERLVYIFRIGFGSDDVQNQNDEEKNQNESE